jgi:hypothetical protein
MIPATDESEWIRLKTAEKLVWRDVEYSRDGYMIGHGPGRKDLKVVPSYARDIRAAWEIVEELILEGADVRIGNNRKGIHEYAVEIRWPGGPLYRAVHERAPTAICLAFLECKQAISSKS